MMNYKGYAATVEYDSDDACLLLCGVNPRYRPTLNDPPRMKRQNDSPFLVS